MGRFVSTVNRGQNESRLGVNRKPKFGRRARKGTPFIPGLRLSELYYHEVVHPLLASNLPNLQYSAGLLGSGSEVLGFDTIQSTDHHWGPRLQVFLSEEDHASIAKQIDKLFARKPPG